MMHACFVRSLNGAFHFYVKKILTRVYSWKGKNNMMCHLSHFICTRFSVQRGFSTN